MDTTSSNDDIYNILGLLQKSEKLGENVLRDRSEIVHMDRIRQKNREALNSLKRKPYGHTTSTPSDEENVYLCVGNMFIKHPVSRARSLIEQDQKQVNDHIEDLRKRIKSNVQQIQELEGRADEMKVFHLNPLTSDEMKSFNVILNSVKRLDLEKM